MHINLHVQIRKVLPELVLGVIALFLCLGASGSPVALAQEAEKSEKGEHHTINTKTLPDGTLVEEVIINGPPVPPPGFEDERKPVSLPESDKRSKP